MTSHVLPFTVNMISRVATIDSLLIIPNSQSNQNICSRASISLLTQSVSFAWNTFVLLGYTFFFCFFFTYCGATCARDGVADLNNLCHVSHIGSQRQITGARGQQKVAAQEKQKMNNTNHNAKHENEINFHLQLSCWIEVRSKKQKYELLCSIFLFLLLLFVSFGFHFSCDATFCSQILVGKMARRFFFYNRRCYILFAVWLWCSTRSSAGRNLLPVACSSIVITHCSNAQLRWDVFIIMPCKHEPMLLVSVYVVYALVSITYANCCCRYTAE